MLRLDSNGAHSSRVGASPHDAMKDEWCAGGLPSGEHPQLCEVLPEDVWHCAVYVEGRPKDDSAITYYQILPEPERSAPPLGRPPLLIDAQRYNVYLDAASRDAALRLGGGNVSAGIRAALRQADDAGKASD